MGLTHIGPEALNLAATSSCDKLPSMKLRVIVHEAQEGGYWAEVPDLPGCATQGETFKELLLNLHEAVEGCLSVELPPIDALESERVLEIVV